NVSRKSSQTELMKELLESISTRETSIIFWSILIFSILIFIARKEFLNVLKAFFNYKIILPLIGFAIYCTIIIYILSVFHLWDVKLLKDTLIWFFTAGVIVFFNSNKISNTNYFIEILKDNLKIIIFLEFVLNFYTFSLITEFILIPILTCITILYEYSKHTMLKNPEHIKVNKFLKSVLSIFGFIMLASVLNKSIGDYKNLFTIDNLKSIYLPIILTILTIPFYYLLALYMIYEEFFIRIDFMFNDQKIKKELKKQILVNANFNLNYLSNIKKNIVKSEIYTNNISSYIKTIKK
ncbi:hypothetical protein, partial [Soonwooa purpurea]